MLESSPVYITYVAGEENTYYDIASRAITHIDDDNVAVLVTHF
jgi:hypothetical protein